MSAWSWVDGSYLPGRVDGSYLPGRVDGTCLPRSPLPRILELVGQWDSMSDLVRSLSKKLSGCENDSVWLWKPVPMGWEFFSLL